MPQFGIVEVQAPSLVSNLTRDVRPSRRQLGEEISRLHNGANALMGGCDVYLLRLASHLESSICAHQSSIVPSI